MQWLQLSLGEYLSCLISFFLFYLVIGRETSCKSLPHCSIPTKHFSYNPGVSSISKGTLWSSPLGRTGSKMAERKLMWRWVPMESFVVDPLDWPYRAWTLVWPLPSTPHPKSPILRSLQDTVKKGWGGYPMEASLRQLITPDLYQLQYPESNHILSLSIQSAYI